MKTHTIILLVLAALVLNGPFHSLRAAERPTICRLPFRVVCPNQGDAVQNAIDAFLSSRLSTDTCMLEIVPADSLNLSADMTPTPDQALGILQKQNGDFLIYGTVVRLGDTLTTDAFLYERAQQKIRVHFQDMGVGDSALLDHLTRFSKLVSQSLSTPCYPGAEPLETTPKPVSDQPFLSSLSVWKSPTLPDDVTGMTLCDLDRDGSIELIAAHEHSLTAFTLEPNQLKPKASFSLSNQLHIVGLDSGAINPNSKPSIYVSAIRDDRHTIGSMVLEWSGTSFDTVQADLPCLFRRIDRSGDVLILTQKNDSLSSLLGSPIVPFFLNGPDETFSATISPPTQGINLYSYTSAKDSLGLIFATYAFNHKIRVYSDAMDLQWESEEDYGGSDRFMSMNDPNDRDRQLHAFLEPRMILLDLDKDGVNELISIKNKETANHLFSSFRHFTTGQIVIFKRNDFGFVPVFETDKVSGHIVDFTLYDVDNDGNPELVYAVSQPGKSLFSNKRAFIVVQKWIIR